MIIDYNMFSLRPSAYYPEYHYPEAIFPHSINIKYLYRICFKGLILKTTRYKSFRGGHMHLTGFASIQAATLHYQVLTVDFLLVNEAGSLPPWLTFLTHISELARY